MTVSVLPGAGQPCCPSVCCPCFSRCIPAIAGRLAGSTSPVQLENSLVPSVELRSEPLRCPGPLRSAEFLSAGPAFPAAAPWLCVIHLLFPKAVNETVWAPVGAVHQPAFLLLSLALSASASGSSSCTILLLVSTPPRFSLIEQIICCVDLHQLPYHSSEM